jgi:hypothetical protein
MNRVGKTYLRAEIIERLKIIGAVLTTASNYWNELGHSWPF